MGAYSWQRIEFSIVCSYVLVQVKNVVVLRESRMKCVLYIT
jgi:hypothetical protein